MSVPHIDFEYSPFPSEQIPTGWRQTWLQAAREWGQGETEVWGWGCNGSRMRPTYRTCRGSHAVVCFHSSLPHPTRSRRQTC